jgi:hypothetical protein
VLAIETVVGRSRPVRAAHVLAGHGDGQQQAAGCQQAAQSSAVVGVVHGHLARRLGDGPGESRSSAVRVRQASHHIDGWDPDDDTVDQGGVGERWRDRDRDDRRDAERDARMIGGDRPGQDLRLDQIGQRPDEQQREGAGGPSGERAAPAHVRRPASRGCLVSRAGRWDSSGAGPAAADPRRSADRSRMPARASRRAGCRPRPRAW